MQKVRIAALKCIEEMTTLPVHIVIPYRGQITRALEPALDDPKRLVRKQAVTARQEWYVCTGTFGPRRQHELGIKVKQDQKDYLMMITGP